MTTCSRVNLSVRCRITVFSETECSCTWSWESDSCSSTSSLLPSYVWAGVVVCLPTSHRRLMLLGQAGRIFNHTFKTIRFESFPLCKFVTYLPQQFPQQIPWRYQTWQSPHSGTLMILLWTGSAGKLFKKDISQKGRSHGTFRY